MKVFLTCLSKIFEREYIILRHVCMFRGKEEGDIICTVFKIFCFRETIVIVLRPQMHCSSKY